MSTDNKTQGIITRVGIIDSAASGGIQFMIENDNSIFVVQATGVTDKIFLSKIGDLVVFEKKKGGFFSDSTFNVEKRTFINKSLMKEISLYVRPMVNLKF